MRNLAVHRLYRQCFRFIGNITENQLSQVRCVVNPNTDTLYVLSGNCIHTLPADRKDVVHFSTLEHSSVKVVGLEYCILTEELYCAYEDGRVVRINAADGKLVEYEVITDCKDGLRCLKLSPDNEIIVAVTSAGTLITMILNFQVISKVDLYLPDFGAKQFIAVGWGQKNTQFHGSEGKAAAKAKPVQISPNESDDGLPRIVWRADGSLFAVSFFHIATKIRQFKVFDREGVLQYTSEPSNGLEECLAWKPSGNLIATTQRLINKHVVVLFEKNGLKHMEFSLPFEPKEVMVKDLLWSPNSDILAIVCKQSSTNNTVVQLWTENNCHWYLKQTIVFPADKPLIFATWSSKGKRHEKELILLTWNEIMFCSYNWCVNQSRGKTMDDKAVIGVIDKKETLITAFRERIVPPPMAHQCLQAEEWINAIFFAPSIENASTKSWINSNTFCTVSCSNKMTFYKQVTNSPEALRYEVFRSYDINSDVSKIDECSVYTMHHFLWFAEDTILCSLTGDNHFLFCLLSLDINSEKDQLTIEYTHIMAAPIEHIIPSPDPDVAYVVANKSVFKYTKRELFPTDINLKDLCCQVEVVKIGGRHVVITLCHTDRFLIDGKEVAKNITSFYVHSGFLLLTTFQHTLICVPLSDNGIEQLSQHDLTVKPWENGSSEQAFAGISIRRIERGSRVIAAISRDSKTILQMPRGNLECIQPRPLSLHIIGSYLNDCNYRTAFDIMRKQRINLNLIYDHNPQLFLNNADKFVEDIAAPSWLSLFLSELQNGDVTATMYANCYSQRSVRSDHSAAPESCEQSTKNKVDRICRILRDIMEKRDDADNLTQPILITMVKSQQSAGLELALKKIKEIQATENLREPVRRSTISAEEALKYLMYLVDINVLYNTALGMYDFELTMFVASKSQKDPKEYVPFLNDLRTLEESYMKYSIDMHLKRYESALEHISRIPNRFEECLDLMRKRNLYTKAIKLFAKSSAEYKRVSGAFGEHLLSEKMYQEAAVMFDKGEDFRSALSAHMLAGNWQDCIIAAKKFGLSPEDSRALYTEMVQRLKTDRKYKEAAEVLRYYLDDIEEAVALLCKGRCWKHAIRTAYDMQRLDLNETRVVPEIKEHVEHTMSQMRKMTQDFIRYKSRLAAVRAEIGPKGIHKNSETICDDTPLFNGEITDFLSDVSSVTGSILSVKSRASATSGRSYRSTKNRRKQERKLFSLKEGSMLEDLGLIHALYQIVSNAYKDRDEWSELIRVLVYLGFDELAEEVQNEVFSFFKLIQNSKSEIWNKSAPTSLTELEKDTYTMKQHQDIIAYLKTVESCLTHPPPESNATLSLLHIF